MGDEEGKGSAAVGGVAAGAIIGGTAGAAAARSRKKSRKKGKKEEQLEDTFEDEEEEEKKSRFGFIGNLASATMTAAKEHFATAVLGDDFGEALVEKWKKEVMTRKMTRKKATTKRKE